MAHFAKLNSDGIVEQVIVVNNEVITNEQGVEEESLGIAFCKSLYGADTEWVQTSYNASMRGKYAGIGDGYSRVDDQFKPRNVSVAQWKKDVGDWVVPEEFEKATKVHVGKNITQLSTPEVRELATTLATTLGLIEADGKIKNGVQAAPAQVDAQTKK